MKKKIPKTQLQKYLAKPLPPYRCGDADCVAFVAEWINEKSGVRFFDLQPMTFGGVVRALQESPLVNQIASHIEILDYVETSEPADGDIIVFEHGPNATCAGIFSDGKVIARMESQKLWIENEPKIVKAWTIKG